MSEVQNLIRKMAGVAELPSRAALFAATVKTVDGRTCTVVPVGSPDEVLIENVRLNADIAGSAGMVITPLADTVVLVGRLSATDHVVVMCSEIEKIEITDGDATVLIAEGAITLNGGENGGLVIIAELVTKLNALEEKVNEILQTLQGVVVPLAPSGAYPLAKDFAAVTPLQPVTKVGDLENEKVKH